MRLDDVLRPKDEEPRPDLTGGKPAGLPHDGSPQAGDTPTSKPAATLEPPVRSVPSRAPGRNVEFSSLGWHSTVSSETKRPLWAAMPTFNRFLSVFGGACLLLALGRVVVPPAIVKAQQAYRPYTTEGKQEICLTHLHSIAVAMAAYSQDNDGRFPPLDYQNAQGKRATWVSLVSGRTAANDLICPVGPNLAGGSEKLTASFVLNPVVATARVSEVDDASATLLLADAGTKHDVSLLPPYPSWPSFGARRPDGGLDAVECNFDFRHVGHAGVAYADGHAGTLSSGSWATDSASWGGSAVLRRSRSRLSSSSATAGELFKRLQNDDVAGAASYLSAHRAALKKVSSDAAALWRLNTGAHTSDSVEKQGWNLAQAWKKTGDASFETSLNEEETRRCQAEAARVNGSSWEHRQTLDQPTMRGEAPSVWNTQEEREGRYKRIYLRSPLPAVYTVLEVGSRVSYVTPQPIDWHGEENSLKSRFGGSYRRLTLTSGTLGGHAASVWEYEAPKAGGPRLHKRLSGYTDGWTSYVVSCAAPAKDWEMWKPVFDKFMGSLSMGYLGDE